YILGDVQAPVHWPIRVTCTSCLLQKWRLCRCHAHRAENSGFPCRPRGGVLRCKKMRVTQSVRNCRKWSDTMIQLMRSVTPYMDASISQLSRSRAFEPRLSETQV